MPYRKPKKFFHKVLKFYKQRLFLHCLHLTKKLFFKSLFIYFYDHAQLITYDIF